jgi:hypothetical protein
MQKNFSRLVDIGGEMQRSSESWMWNLYNKFSQRSGVTSAKSKIGTQLKARKKRDEKGQIHEETGE